MEKIGHLVGGVGLVQAGQAKIFDPTTPGAELSIEVKAQPGRSDSTGSRTIEQLLDRGGQ